MEIGHRVEIEYRIKVYRKGKKFLNLFGDKLVRDIRYSYIGKKNLLKNKFYITSEKEIRKSFDVEKEFVKDFYVLDNLKVDLVDEKKGEYYALGRVNLKVIKLIPPLNLFSFIIPGIIDSSDWVNAGHFRIN